MAPRGSDPRRLTRTVGRDARQRPRRLRADDRPARGREGANTEAMRIRRFSKSHLVVELTLAGRGLYFSRTPDGAWWKLRLRRRSCPPPLAWEPPEAPPDSWIREPRRPYGPGPLDAAGELELPS